MKNFSTVKNLVNSNGVVLSEKSKKMVENQVKRNIFDEKKREEEKFQMKMRELQDEIALKVSEKLKSEKMKKLRSQEKNTGNFTKKPL